MAYNNRDLLNDSFDFGNEINQLEMPRPKKDQAFYSEIGRKGGRARARNAKKKAKSKR